MKRLFEAGQRRCRICREVKPLAEFARNRTQYGGHASQCRPCSSEYYRRYGEAHPTFKRNEFLKQHYGLTLVEFEALNAAQGGVCAICHGPPTGTRKVLDVDHDHATGRVRALLCHRCNSMVGFIETHGELVEAMRCYLSRHQ